MELVDEPFVEREIAGVTSRDQLDRVGTHGTGIEINHGPAGDHGSQSILQEPASLGIDDQPELLFTAAITEADADVPQFPRRLRIGELGSSIEIRGVDLGALDG